MLGAGLERPLTESHVADFHRRFAAGGARRFFVQVPPGDHAAAELLARLGLPHHNDWIRLVRALDRNEDPERAVPDPDVRRVGPAEARAFGTLAADSFDWPAEVAELIARTVGRPGWSHFAVLDRGEVAATAAMFRSGTMAWFDFAATREDFRGRGAQKALIRTRIRAAREEGCRTAVVEAAAPRPDYDAPSYRNLLRLGFREVYRRPNFLGVIP